MKKLSVIILSLILSIVIVLGATKTYSVVLGWGANPDPTVAGYKIYTGGSTRNYTNVIMLGKVTSGKIPNIVPGQPYYFAVTAYNSNGLESVYSPEVIYTMPTNPLPSKVENFQLQFLK